ncbi:MAG: c-type cytochrome [Rhizobiaceae bacterium]|nr:c-type cytochrome [Rhizobiaceae bacterium]
MIVLGGGILLATAWVLAGAYNVAASAKHFYVTDRLLKLVLYRSVDTYSAGIEVPPLRDAGLVRLGARHFVTGCQPCHAGPGMDQSPIAASMYPAAPALGNNVEDWESRELFWIVRHGLKFTGMPHWPGEGRDSEVWAVVAFLRELPKLSPQEYAELTRGPRSPGHGFPLDRPDLMAQCSGCHGDADNGPVASLAPSLNGQNTAYLIRALEEYAAGSRESGMMEPIAAALTESAREQLAQEFGSFASPTPSPPDGDSAERDARIARGAGIARDGIAQQNIPPCLACHSPGKSGQFPRLEALSEGYLIEQLNLFRDGTRSGTPYAEIMAPIARRLTKDQIADAAAYFSSVERGAREAPAAHAEARP